MIKQNILEEGKIVGLKLITGEELATKIVGIHANDVIVSKPRMLGMVEKGMTLMPYLMMADDETNQSINRNNIVSVFALTKEMITGYEKVTSPIDIVQKPGIIV